MARALKQGDKWTRIPASDLADLQERAAKWDMFRRVVANSRKWNGQYVSGTVDAIACDLTAKIGTSLVHAIERQHEEGKVPGTSPARRVWDLLLIHYRRTLTRKPQPTD